MSNQINVYYIKSGAMVWYFDDINRRSVIEAGLVQLHAFMLTKPSRKQFDQNPDIQRLLREVPELRAKYQKHIRDNVVFDSHTPVA